MMADEADIREIAKEVISKQLGDDVNIISVSIGEDKTSDSDCVILVRVVYDVKTGCLDGKRTAGIIRHLRSKLFDVSEERFPILSFVYKGEAKTEAA